SPFDATHCADDMRSAAAERRPNSKPAFDRQIRARTAEPPPKAELSARADEERGVERHAPAVDGQLELGARDSHHTLRVEFELRTDQRHFERGGGRTVSDQRVRQAVRARIHRTGYRHTL